MQPRWRLEDLLAQWSTAQWICLIIAATLILSYLTVSLLTNAGMSVRRWTGLGCFALLWLCMHFVLGGATFDRLPRNVVLVASCQDHQAVAEYAINQLALDQSQIKLLKFTSTPEDPLCQSPASSQGLTAVTGVLSPDENAKPPLTQLFNMARDLAGFDISRPLAGIRDLFTRTTIIFLYQQNEPAWDNGLALDHSKSSDLLQVENIDHMDVFVFEKDQAKPSGRLKLHLLGNVDPEQKYRNSNQLLKLTVSGLYATASDPIKIKLCMAIDQAADLASCHSKDGQLYFDNIPLIPDPQSQERSLIWEIPGATTNISVSDLVYLAKNSNKETVAGKVFAPGWHSISAVAEVISGSSSGLQLPLSISHFEVKSSGITVIKGKNELFELNWPIPPDPKAIDQMLTKIWRPGSARFDGLSAIKDILEPTASISEIRASMRDAKTLILIEPGLPLLQQIHDAGLVQDITGSGGSILIAGPPPLSAINGLDQWLPGWASQSNGQVQRVETTRQITLIGDCGLLAHQPFADDNDAYLDPLARRPIDLQNEIHDLLLNKFNRPELSKFALAPQQELLWFEQNNDWAPATKISGSLGCIRPALDKAPQATALTELADPAWRLHAFTSDKSLYPGPPFGHFKAENLYPGSTVILLSTPVYRPGSGPSLKVNSIAGHGRRGSKINAPEATELFKKIKEQGIELILVELPANAKFADATTKAQWHNAVSNWQTQGVKYLPALGDSDAADYADAIYQLLQQQSSHTDLSLQIKQHGRGLDPRLIEISSLIPPAWSNLTISPEADTLVSSSWNNSPLLLERKINNGRVAVLAFNPFSPQLWISDILDPNKIAPIFSNFYPSQALAKQWLTTSIGLPRLSGPGKVSKAMGIQRMIDAVAQMAVETPEEHALTLERIAVAPGQDEIDFVFQIPVGSDTWPVPSIKLERPKEHCISVVDNKACELNLITLDQQNGRASYRFSTLREEGIKAGEHQQLHLGKPNGRELVEPVWFWLNKKERLNSLPKERLFGLIRSIGGEVLKTPSAFPPHASTSAIELAAIMFLLLTLLLFSPLIRPWTAFMRWRRRFELIGNQQNLGFDPDTVSRRLSELLARYEAKRRAGDPAWLRRFQSGDSLSRAVSSDLAAFLPLGKKLDLPKVPPRVRLREIGEGFEFLIFVDNSPSLSHPGNLEGNSKKMAATQSLVDIIARSVARLGGRWSLHSLRGQGSMGPLKKHNRAAVAQNLNLWLKQAKEQGELQSLPNHASQAITLVISDFMTNPIEHYLKILNSHQSRVVLLRDPEQSAEAGFSYDAVSGKFYDRSEWQSKDLDSLILSHRLEVRSAMELAGHKFADISVEGSDLEIAEALIRADLFDTTGTVG